MQTLDHTLIICLSIAVKFASDSVSLMHNHLRLTRFESAELQTKMDSSDFSSKKQKTNEDRDIISNLPDDIIGHILSFLLTKQAVSTCVLSQRWKKLWTFITKLHFIDRKQQCFLTKISTDCFIHSVYRVLLHTSAIQTFTLSLSKNYDSCHINGWISILLRRGGVKKLVISCSLWKSHSLEKLVLDINGATTLPTIASLTSLTVLKLSGITFTCHSENLSLNFPVLKGYEEENCIWLNVKNVTFEMPLLQKLLIKYTLTPKAVELKTVFKFCASHLTRFSYSGNGLPHTILLDLDTTTRIASADVATWCYEENVEKTAIFASELLKQFNNNVEYLEFRPFKVIGLVQDDLPAFGMLTRLELEHVNGNSVLNILQNTPLLKTLILRELLKFDEEHLNHENVPSCLVCNLEVLKFRILNGEEHELCLAKFVIEHAQVLKKATFLVSLSVSWSNFENFRKKILLYKGYNSSAITECVAQRSDGAHRSIFN